MGYRAAQQVGICGTGAVPRTYTQWSQSPKQLHGFPAKSQAFCSVVYGNRHSKGGIETQDVSSSFRKRSGTLSYTPPAASAQDRFVWILCSTQALEERSSTREVGGAAAFFILEEKRLEHSMSFVSGTGSCVTLCTQISMLSSSERSNCLFSKWLWIFKFFDINFKDKGGKLL